MRAQDAIGRYGEDVAARRLGEAGLTVIERNWRCREGEIDIVAVEGATLVFCEVKTRSTVSHGSPAEAVTTAKAARLRRLALRWLAARREAGGDQFWSELRFDVVCVMRRPRGAATVDHVRGAF
jgi:putative endonuclease